MKGLLQYCSKKESEKKIVKGSSYRDGKKEDKKKKIMVLFGKHGKN